MARAGSVRFRSGDGVILVGNEGGKGAVAVGGPDCVEGTETVVVARSGSVNVELAVGLGEVMELYSKVVCVRNENCDGKLYGTVRLVVDVVNENEVVKLGNTFEGVRISDGLEDVVDGGSGVVIEVVCPGSVVGVVVGVVRVPLPGVDVVDGVVCGVGVVVGLLRMGKVSEKDKLGSV